MRITIDPGDGDRPAGGLGRRLLWFVGLYAAGVLVVSAVALGLRAVLPG